MTQAQPTNGYLLEKKAGQKGHSIWRQAKDQRPPSKEMAGDEKKKMAVRPRL